MDSHLSFLRTACRLCGKVLSRKSDFADKSLFKNELLNQFQINIEKSHCIYRKHRQATITLRNYTGGRLFYVQMGTAFNSPLTCHGARKVHLKDIKIKTSKKKNLTAHIILGRRISTSSRKPASASCLCLEEKERKKGEGN